MVEGRGTGVERRTAQPAAWAWRRRSVVSCFLGQGRWSGAMDTPSLASNLPESQGLREVPEG